MTISPAKLNPYDITARINGCWLGKAIGGTLGCPHEGKPGPLSLDFYDPVPTGVIPNDDLDLQIVWLCYLLEKKVPRVTPGVLSAAWKKHVEFPYDEYAVCLRNIYYGLNDHRLGSHDNWYSECMGAAIRSELWACLAPGDPERAAGFAWCDAVCDHAGDGVWAEIFLAALEAAAFVEQHREKLLDLALDFLPSTSRVKQAVMLTRAAWQKTGDWSKVRLEIEATHGDPNFWDVAANLAFTILGWLGGEGDFGKSLCIAANCGRDVDCTAASLGALLGILNPENIPLKWRAPVGEEIVLSKQIIGLSAPPTISALTSLTLRLRDQLADDKPVIGQVLPRQPSTGESASMQISAVIGWGEEHCLQSKQAPQVNQTKMQFPGHWIHRASEEFLGAVMLVRMKFSLEKEWTVRMTAWSQTQTSVWINRIRCENAPLDPVSGRSPFGGPSAHRGGRGHFLVEKPLSAGEHELIVAWKAPDDWADLVIGISDSETLQWIPDALVRNNR